MRHINCFLGAQSGGFGWGSKSYVEKMYVFFSSLELLLTPPATPGEPHEKQTVGTVTASHKMLTLQALSSSLNAGIAKRGCQGRGEAFFG